jgi:hypothetical protein
MLPSQVHHRHPTTIFIIFTSTNPLNIFYYILSATFSAFLLYFSTFHSHPSSSHQQFPSHIPDQFFSSSLKTP